MIKITHELSLKISFAMLVATILVVIRHSMNVHIYHPDIYTTGFQDFNSFIQLFLNSLTDIAVPFFFIMSGYLFFKDFEVKDTIIKWKRRLSTLLLPYILWNLLLITFLLGIQNWSLTAGYSNYEPIELKISSILPLLTINPAVGQFWYIRDLLFFICLAPAFFFLYYNKYVAVFFLLVLAVIWHPVDTSIFSTEGLFFFGIGGFLGHHNINIMRKALPKTIIILLILWISLKTLLILQNGIEKIYIEILQKISVLVGIYFFWISLDLLMRRVDKEKILNIAPYAFFLYAFHTPLIKILYKGVLSILPKSQAIGLTVFFLAPIIVILMTLILARFMEKQTPDFYRLLTGNRSRRKFSLQSNIS